ncbi:MAG: hypothetical protein KDB79_15875 [Acidobacteria bacterium]|nr:hypothetical protein [Acidobacteriota bacterium]
MKTFDAGNEERLLFTCNSSEGFSDLPRPEPIFIHNEDCDPFVSEGFPEKLRDLPMLFEGLPNLLSGLKNSKLNRILKISLTRPR